MVKPLKLFPEQGLLWLCWPDTLQVKEQGLEGQISMTIIMIDAISTMAAAFSAYPICFRVLLRIGISDSWSQTWEPSQGSRAQILRIVMMIDAMSVMTAAHSTAPICLQVLSRIRISDQRWELQVKEQGGIGSNIKDRYDNINHDDWCDICHDSGPLSCSYLGHHHLDKETDSM